MTVLPKTGSFQGVSVDFGAGNMQAIKGEVDVVATDPTKWSPSVTLDDSADTVGQNIHLQFAADGSLQVTGMSPGLINLVGLASSALGPFSTPSPFIELGKGSNVFQIDSPGPLLTMAVLTSSNTDQVIGPNLTNTWSFSSTGFTTLDSVIALEHFASFTGGTGADTFTDTFSGTFVPGNLDGGAGTDTLSYLSSSFWQTGTFDLAHGKAPGVAGTTSNLEIVPFEMPSPGSQSFQSNIQITPLQIPTRGGLGTFTWTATGLPAGLSINTSGQIVGTLLNSAVSATPYTVNISATDGFNTASTSFQISTSQGAVDNTPPTSRVTPLPAYESSATFNLSWSGSDPGGSGVATFDIYVSDNGGAYSLFKSATTSFTAAFNGVDGHTYSFYSVATDNAGNIESKTPIAEGTTLVDTTPPPAALRRWLRPPIRRPSNSI